MATEKNRLILSFTTSTGYTKNLYVDYPVMPAVPAKVKALGDFVKTSQIMVYQDGSEIATFDGASVETVTTTEINLEA